MKSCRDYGRGTSRSRALGVCLVELALITLTGRRDLRFADLMSWPNYSTGKDYYKGPRTRLVDHSFGVFANDQHTGWVRNPVRLVTG